MKIRALVVLVTALSLSACQSTLESTMSTISTAATNVVSNVMSESNEPSQENLSKQFRINPALASQDHLLAAYGTSVILMFTAQEVWLDAMGNEEGAAQLRTERIALENGSVIDSDAIDRFTELSQETKVLIEETGEKEEAMSDKGKLKFAAGWVPYLAGLYQTRAVVMKSSDYASEINRSKGNVNSLLSNAKKTLILTTFVQSSPAFLKVQYDTFGLIMDYAREQDIEIPADANSVLRDIEL